MEVPEIFRNPRDIDDGEIWKNVDSLEQHFPELVARIKAETGTPEHYRGRIDSLLIELRDKVGGSKVFPEHQKRTLQAWLQNLRPGMAYEFLHRYRV